jgi:serine/threonine protein kinase
MSGSPTDASAPTDASLAGKVVGGCRLERLLGVGGMGAVWRAHHLALDVPVAIKLMLPIKDLDPNAGERLLREARAAARLRHPNIVGVLNVGEDAGQPFLVMELVEGQSLQKLLDERGSLPVEEALGFALQILSALEVTFEHRIVHRDIKPDNILIDAKGVAKLADLGLAKRADSDLSLTQTGTVMGSPYYIAPEQASNSKAADPRADLYSLGCVLFHLLVGAPPYTGATYMEVLLKHISGPLPDLGRLGPRLPKGLVSVVLRLMAKSPAARYQTPQEVRAALAPFASTVSVVSGPPRQNLGGPVRSRRALWMGGATAVAMALLVGLWPRHAAPPTPVAAPTPLPPPATTAAADVPPAVALPRRRERRRPRLIEQAPAPYGDPDPSLAEQPQPWQPSPRPTSAASALSRALANHDTDRLRELLDRGTPPNVGDGTTSPLHQAVHMGNPQYVRMLLEKGANPNTRDEAGETPLHYALRRRDRTSVSALLDFGANPNLRDRYGQTPLGAAAGDEFLVRKLREKGANP